MTVTRFAPSPTGDLHLGGAWTALASWALARSHGGRMLLRVEDIDPPRVVSGSARRIAQDLGWLGLDWDEGPIAQSTRSALYEASLARLSAAGLTYPCDCSRAEIARAASAPHPGEESPETIYPRTCRDADPGRIMKRDPAIRLRVPEGLAPVRFEDDVLGPIEEDVARVVGDFVLRRGDGVFSYQLAVAIDDAAMAITDVVRGADLLASTARQLLLLELLGVTHRPRYAHIPLVVAKDGQRLAKRTEGATVRELRDRGVPAGHVVAKLAHGLGLVPPGAHVRAAADVAATLTKPSTWRRTPWPLPGTWEDQNRNAM